LCSDSAHAKSETYIVGKEDVLDISVWKSPELSKRVTVESDGRISYPLIGEITAAGSSTESLAKKIEVKLSDGFLNDPKVSVSVAEYNSKKILVFGEVSKPGLFKLKGSIPLLELIFMVEGITSEGKRMTIIRAKKQANGEAIPSALVVGEQGDEENVGEAIEVDLLALLSKGDLSQNVMIMPGDTIYVSAGTGRNFYVLGRVKSPGPYEWSEEITLLEAVKQAGGFAAGAAINRIKMRKAGQSEGEGVKINVKDIMNGKQKDDTVVEPDDIIIVPQSWI